MSFEEIEFWQKIRKKGFLFFFLTAFSFMMLILIFIGSIIDLFIVEESFSFEEFIWWDLPINIILSVLFAIYTWYFGNKRLKLKSNIIEMKLNKDNGKKEK